MIEVQVSSTLRRAIDKGLLDRAARAALSGQVRDAEVSVAVVGDKRMRRLNRESLGHDYVTDVLSYDHGNTPEGRLLEVIICASHAGRQANQYGVPFNQELARYVIHGLLHTIGYNDGTEDERHAMWAEQERIMRKLFGPSYRAPE